MCGICGYVAASSPETLPSDDGLKAFTHSLHHRGPDACGHRLDREAGVYLGQQRLSIIDLSAAGQQPFFSEDRSIAAVVNGEIYNYRELRATLTRQGHRFISESDSEVVVHLYEEFGHDLWSKLRGMFAAAIYDSRERTISLARDPLGIKPLYVYQEAGAIAFSSEIQAFKVLSRKLTVSPEAITRFLLLGCVRAPDTIYKNIRAMQPGETAVIQAGHITYSNPLGSEPWMHTATPASSASLEDVRAGLHDSVRRHLISDAPIGLFLSGGIDSGVIAGLAREVTQSDVRAVSVVVPNHPMDEGRYARQTAEQYGIELTEIPLSQAGFEANMDMFFRHIDQPTVDGFNTFVVSQAAREAGLTVSLSGLGGDELFGGYPTFSWIPHFGRIHRLASLLGSASRLPAAALLKTFRRESGAQRVAAILRNMPADRRTAWLSFRGLFVEDIMRSLLLPEWHATADSTTQGFLDTSAWALNPDIPTPIAVAGLEIENYMIPMLLRDTDVFSMAHSLEVRVPFVDKEVLRLALPLLNATLPTDGSPKWALRQSLNVPLPESVVSRTKQGFTFPWQEWMAGFALQDFDRMLNEAGDWRAWLDPQGLTNLRDSYVRGQTHWRCFWALYVLLRVLV